MKQLYIFDLDGMILDTFEDSMNCINKTLKEFGILTYDEDINTLDYPTFRQ